MKGRKTIFLWGYVFWMVNFIPLQNGETSSSWEVFCQEFVKGYESAIAQLTDSRRSFSSRLSQLERIQTSYFVSDSNYLYDDLYLYQGPDQYFLPGEYLFTAISWYPNGVSIQYQMLSIGNCCIAASGNEAFGNVQVRRVLKGTDFLENLQTDTTDLEIRLEVSLESKASGLRLATPQIHSIVPLARSRETSDLLSEKLEPLRIGIKPQDTLPLRELDEMPDINGPSNPVINQADPLRIERIREARARLLEIPKYKRKKRKQKDPWKHGL